MSGQRDVLDPRLGGATNATGTTQRHTDVPPRAPPPSTYPGLKSDAAASYQPSQPYYHYPSPQTHTPQQLGVHSGSHSTQESPATSYAARDENAASPDIAGAGDDDDGDNAEDAKRPRACEACRGLKVRCDQDPARPDIPCKRCAKAGRQCIVTQPTRRRQKKADSRVAELERKLDALTAALQQQHQTGPGQHHRADEGSAVLQPLHPTAAYDPMSTSSDGALPPGKRRRTDDTINTGRPLDTADNAGKRFENDAPIQQYYPASSPQEFTARINALVKPELAAKLFTRYTTKLARHLPAVIFPPHTTHEMLFKDKPILFVCILSAASYGQVEPELSRSIAKEAVGAIADCVVRHGAKSLELIQAMQVLAMWYKPPERADQSNFYQLIHMAAVMALDIGLGKRFNPAKARRGFGGPNANYAPGPHHILPQDSDTLEARRAWLGCYFTCASASMVLRRPNLVRWTNYMKECIEVLESHPDAADTDKLFCQFIKIQNICEDIGHQFVMDDNTANHISLTDPKVTYTLKILENKLTAWKEQLPAECQTPGLKMYEHVTSLYLHEIALHLNHNVEDFRLPFTEESLKSVNSSSDTLTPSQMSALEACLKSAHGILDTMLSIEVVTIKEMPTLIYFIRCTYAIVILIKMHVAVCTPNSELGKMMAPADLKVDFYIDSLLALFDFMATDELFRPHSKVLRILNLLRGWFGKHKANVAAQQRGEQPQQHQQQTPAEDHQPQTPLHLLSEVAIGEQQHQPAQANGGAAGSKLDQQSQDWTFTSPYVFDMNPKGRGNNSTDVLFPVNQQQQQQVYSTDSSYPMVPSGDAQGAMDLSNLDYGWGTNFEQAMDMALGGMDGLHAGGLDEWFLGDSMAPFTFTGDNMAVGGNGQWQADGA